MANRLAGESSPYLLQHADNPVDWRPWGPEALAEARAADRPIFLSIGYSTCHWCHVMAHESFEDPSLAAKLNQDFIPIKVDREERPDVDSVYMDAVVALTGQGGWPLSVFLTPSGEPFFGGTYFPPAPRHGLPSFGQVLEGVAEAWRGDPGRLRQAAADLVGRLAERAAPGARGALSEVSLDRAAEAFLRAYDWTHGGWGGAPKFPQAMSVEALLRRHHRADDALARDMAAHCLRAMAAGGLRDHLAGGFHRYATDADWRIPHFEKMLYDNAQLALAYLHAWQVTGEGGLRRVAEETLDFLRAEMRDPAGGFYAALDADSEGEEGRFYAWSAEEVLAALEDESLTDLAAAAWGVVAQGAFEGRNVLRRAAEPAALSERFGLPEPEVEARLEQARQRLLAARARRPRPGLDDKVISSWNGLLLMALAEAGRALPRPDLLADAQALARFALEHLFVDGALRRSWRRGAAGPPAFLEDHAALGLGLLTLYESDFDPVWFEAAQRLAARIPAEFGDSRGGFFDTPQAQADLPTRPRADQDNATPSGGALATRLLLRLAAHTGDEDLRRTAEAALERMVPWIERYPTGFAAWLAALDEALGPQHQLAIAGEPDDERARAFAARAHARYTPRLVLAAGPPEDPGAHPLLRERTAGLDGGAVAYLCQGFICRLPAYHPDDLEAQLREVG